MSEGGFDALVQEIFDRLERIEGQLDDILAMRGSPLVRPERPEPLPDPVVPDA